MENDQLNDLDDEGKFPNRVDKALAWLSESRNKWREKCKVSKLQLKRQAFANKRLKEGRDSWKFTCTKFKQEVIQNKQKISSLEKRIRELESQTENYRNEIQILKKKQ